MHILKELKTVTHDIHERLHNHPMLSNLVTENLTFNDYRWVLFAFERFYEGLENQVNFELIQEKLCLIRKDTNSLGFKENPLPKCTYFKNKYDQNHILGIKYVIIGSALGGSLISKNIEKIFKLESGNGNSYFGSSPDTARTYWKNFQSMLEEECTDIQNCSTAALNIFEVLEKWLWDVYKVKNERV